MLSLNRQAIALISDHADPAAEIGREEAGGQNVYVRHVGETLAALGWQVDMFTRKVHKDDPVIVQHSLIAELSVSKLVLKLIFQEINYLSICQNL